MREERLALGGAVLAAFTSSVCCIGPLLAVALGVGAFGAAAALQSARPYMLVGASAFLAFGFYRAYFRRQPECAPGDACVTMPADRTSRAALWMSSALVLAFALWPYYAGSLLRGTDTNVTLSEAKIERATFRVTGMTCGGCEPTIKLVLDNTAGVKSATVSYDRSEAVVDYDPKVTTKEKLRDIINETGYAAEILK
ncbi:MAG: mercuric transporter MerT family protein [Blastocatellia bacterium]